ncbi:MULTISPECIES: hypothetical protein [unclassified Microcoleus]|uniref:hypothetical protein n=1 Tax=unclassified Microcoleus TaxID=2642155 RepID=UPI002FD65D57
MQHIIWIGNWALGIGNWALGIGHWALVSCPLNSPGSNFVAGAGLCRLSVRMKDCW